MHVPSADGVAIVHDLGGSGAALLVSHATGFHGRCYQPLAHRLPGRHCIAFDYRGHGDTPRPPGPIDWQRYGDDTLAMAEWLADREGAPIDAFGHSMGAACLLMAAYRRPELFRRIVAFEPVVFPPGYGVDPEHSPMVRGALRRRDTYDSYEEAIANYSSKPPMRAFHPEALEAYVRHGFAEGRDGKVHLKCTRETEAETFATGALHDTWQHLPEITTDVVVVSGRVEPNQPSSRSGPTAERLPNSRHVQCNELDHFGPMTHPAHTAEVIAAALA